MTSSNSTTKKYNKKGFAPRVPVEGIKYCDNCNYVNVQSATKCLICGAEFSNNSDASDPTVTDTAQGTTKTFKVTLNNPGAKKLEVIKAIQHLSKCKLNQAKKIASSCPHAVITGVTREEAVKAAGTLRSLGASVTIE